jgi:O-acetyl-ADP-ribose deacetylase (regulator of RNase III)
MDGTAMITRATGNLLTADVEALVNTVNTVGVMGKGIALQFKRAYPDMFRAYAKAAKAGEVRIGEMWVWETDSLTGPRYVINFPTKRHWRTPSRLADVDAGLVDLVKVVRDRSIRSIAVPPLGCGNGGLDWAVVEPRILGAFGSLPHVDVRVFPPNGAPAAVAMPSATRKPAMTTGRAALIELLSQYAETAVEASRIEVQKLMYFMQVAGEPLRLTYVKGIYGPYADNLRHVLDVVEGHYLIGYGDGSAKVLEAEPLRLLPGAVEAAESVLGESVETRYRIERVLDLVSGFESMYGLELLASVHWVVSTECPGARADPAAAAEVIRSWTPRKARLFTTHHVEVAMQALDERGWLPAA